VKGPAKALLLNGEASRVLRRKVLKGINTAQELVEVIYKYKLHGRKTILVKTVWGNLKFLGGKFRSKTCLDKTLKISLKSVGDEESCHSTYTWCFSRVMALLRFKQKLITKSNSSCAVLQYLSLLLFVIQPFSMHIATEH